MVSKRGYQLSSPGTWQKEKKRENRRGFRQFPVDEIWLLAPNANFPVLINYSDREASSGAATKGEVNWIVGRKRG